MKAVLQRLLPGGSVRRRAALLAVVIGALCLLPAHGLQAQDARATDRSKADATALPARSADVGPYIAKMDDRQVRALLVRVLEERTQVSAPEQNDDMLMMLESTTDRLSARVHRIAGASGEAATAPSMFWRWLTAGGTDPRAPLRAAFGVVILLTIGWAAQAAAAAALRAGLRGGLRPAQAGVEPSNRVAAAVMLLRFLAFLGALAIAHALVPEVARPSRLTALAIVLTVAGTWIGSRTISHVLPALLAKRSLATGMRLRGALLQLSLGVFFGGLFGIVLLRAAGMSEQARVLIGTIAWLVFGMLFLGAFALRRRMVAEQVVAEHVAAEPEAEAEFDPIERWLDRHGVLLLRLAFVVIFTATPLVALWRGPVGFWSGIMSFALLVALVAALGLARTPMRPPSAAEVARAADMPRTADAAHAADVPSAADVPLPASPWVATLRRALRFLILVGFTLALAAVWKINLFQAANAQLGETLVRGIMTVAVTVTLAYLVWELIRTALAQSALGPPRTTGEPGGESGEAAATRLQTFGPVLRNFLLVIVITIATLVCLSSLGVNIAPLLAGAGVIGIALGFGAQTLVRDVISGVFFLAEDAFRIGEYVVIGTTRGKVEGIAIRSLRLRHHRGAVHTVPFGEIRQLTNESRDWVIEKMTIGITYDSDVEKARKIIKKIGLELAEDPEFKGKILEPLKMQGVHKFGDFAIELRLKMMTKPHEQYVPKRRALALLKQRFAEGGIKFAYPVVQIAGGSTAEAAAASVVLERRQTAAP